MSDAPGLRTGTKPDAGAQSEIAELHELEIGYPARRGPSSVVLDKLTASLFRGELVCLLGPNGSGKSTLLRTVAGFQPPLRGTVKLAGRPIAELSPKELAMLVSVVLTERVDVGLLTARELVALGRYPYTRWDGGGAERDERVVEWAIAAMNARPLAGRPVATLSDGERQKIMIARALAQEPGLLILDEPTAFLDLPRRIEVMALLARLAHEEGKAVLLSTHDLELAHESADRIWLITADRRLAVGAPEDLVLSGSFAAAFANDGLRFDPSTGTLRAVHVPRAVVGLRGEGNPRYWTRHALERAGFAVDDRCADPLVSIGGGAAPRVWEIRAGRQRIRCESLYEVVRHLRSLRADGAPT